MNIIINKFQLPCDMKYEIDSFCYDNCGYTSEEIDFKEILKKRYRSNFLRIKIDFGKVHYEVKFFSSKLIVRLLCNTHYEVNLFALQMYSVNPFAKQKDLFYNITKYSYKIKIDLSSLFSINIYNYAQGN